MNAKPTCDARPRQIRRLGLAASGLTRGKRRELAPTVARDEDSLTRELCWWPILTADVGCPRTAGGELAGLWLRRARKVSRAPLARDAALALLVRVGDGGGLQEGAHRKIVLVP